MLWQSSENPKCLSATRKRKTNLNSNHQDSEKDNPQEYLGLQRNPNNQMTKKVGNQKIPKTRKIKVKTMTSTMKKRKKKKTKTKLVTKKRNRNLNGKSRT